MFALFVALLVSVAVFGAAAHSAKVRRAGGGQQDYLGVQESQQARMRIQVSVR